jgi:hypothetical protein
MNEISQGSESHLSPSDLIDTKIKFSIHKELTNIIRQTLLGQELYYKTQYDKILKSELDKKCHLLKISDTNDLINICELNNEIITNEDSNLFINNQTIQTSNEFIILKHKPNFRYYESQEELFDKFRIYLLGEKLYNNIIDLELDNLENKIIERCNYLKKHNYTISPEFMKKIINLNTFINENKLFNQIIKDLPITIDYKYATNKSLLIAIIKQKKDIVKNLVKYCEIDEICIIKSLTQINSYYDIDIFKYLYKYYKYQLPISYFTKALHYRNNYFIKFCIDNNILDTLDLSKKEYEDFLNFININKNSEIKEFSYSISELMDWMF